MILTTNDCLIQTTVSDDEKCPKIKIQKRRRFRSCMIASALLASTSIAVLSLVCAPAFAQALENVVDDGDVVTIPGMNLSFGWPTIIGKNSEGTLYVLQGVDLSSFDVTLGENSGSVGTAYVREGSTWNTRYGDGQTFIGKGGVGELFIEGSSRFLTFATEIRGGSRASVSGPSSVWDIVSASRGDTLAINGILEVSNGGALTSTGYIVAENGGSINVTGANSRITTTNDVAIHSGLSGPGSMRIENGGTVQSHHGYITSHDGKTSNVTVTGSGSQWLADPRMNTAGDALTAELGIGTGGYGNLIIADAARVTDWLEISLGRSPDAKGTITVSDEDSFLGGYHLSIGQAYGGIFGTIGGSGVVLIEHGGGVGTFYADIGHSERSTGTVTVTGDGSGFSAREALNVGLSGAGTFLVEKGAFVSAEDTMLGVESGSSASVTVTGAGSRWSSDELVIGQRGSATLSVEDGAALNANYIEIALQPTGVGTLVLSGSESHRSVVTSRSIRGWNGSSSVILDGGVLRAGASGTLLSDFQPGDIVIEDGGAFLDTAGNNATINASLGGDGELAKQGAGILTLTQTNTYDGSTTLEHGTLALSGSGTLGAGILQMAAGTIFDIATKTGGLTLDNLQGEGAINLGANWLALTEGSFSGAILGSGPLIKRGDGTLTLDGISNYTGGTIIQSGTLVAHANGLGSGPVSNNGHLVFDQATSTIVQNVIAGAGSVEKRGGGTLELSGPLLQTYTGLTTVNAGTLRLRTSLRGDVQVNASGTFEGDGSVKAVAVADGGTLAGTAGTQLSMTSLSLGGGSVLDVTLMPSAGALFNVAGNISLNGELRLNANSDLDFGTFQLMEYRGALSGSGLTLRTLPADYSPDSLSLSTDNGRVNLVISAVTGDQYWKGGAGTWASGPDWNDAGGNLTTSWGGRRAIFGGAAGVVDVAGSQSFASLHFQSDGYRLREGIGGALCIAGADGFVRVNSGMVALLDLPVTGSGMLVKMGAGALILSDNNDYAGGTQIQAGTLVGSATSFGPGDIQNSGTLEVQQVADGTLAANISGTGMLHKSGSGTLELTGTNSYTGGTRITEGKIFVSRDANLGASNSSIEFNNGTLMLGSAFGLSVGRTLVMNTGSGVLETTGGDVTVRSAITGGGYFVKDGAGSLTLLGPSTHTGPTIVDQGMLIANANSIGSGNITNMSELVIDQAINATMAQEINGTGSFTKRGGGRLTLIGNSNLTGDTLVQQGNLAVNGSLASSDVTVGANAVLSGTGTVGGIVAASGGAIAPGNSIGTLNVADNVAFQAGSIYQVEVNAAGQSDMIAATGTATLTGGTVQVLAESGTYQPSTTYTILTANGGLAGTFAGVTSNFAYLDPTLVYDANTASLTLVRKTVPTDPPTNPTDPTEPDEPAPTPVAFHSVAASANQYRTADAVEALGSGNRLFNAVLGQSVSGARQAFDALSGEAHASATAVAYADSRLVREAILTRLRQPLGASLPTFAHGSYGAAYAADLPGTAPQPVVVTPASPAPRFALWGEGFGSWGKIDSNRNAAGLNTSTGGFILGADAQVSDAFRLGVAGAFTRTIYDVDARLSSGSNDSIYAALYGSGTWGGLNLRLGASYVWHDFDVSRTVSFPGFSDRTHASYGGWTAQAFGELGYQFSLGAVQLEPFVGASVLRLHTDGFVEEGGPAALAGYGRNQDLATTTLGVRAEARISQDMPLTLRGLLGWRHAYGDVNPSALLAFSGGASAFNVAGIPIDRDALVAEAGLDWQIDRDITLGMSYSGQIGERAQDHAVKGNFSWRFETY